ncbi:MAG: hypothetical protein IPK63_23325 [Candidatus Competibacteraceae bacterium]|nr:hypothetical protein [Candidatus Competibacteraceae bacterium]
MPSSAPYYPDPTRRRPRRAEAHTPPDRALPRRRRTDRDRCHSAYRRLVAGGIPLYSHGAGAHLIAGGPRCPLVDVWPHTGVWAERGRGKKKYHGLRRLLDFLHHNR